ncbi:MAG: Crp/Fnr family transcriptional regulator [Flavobacteriales bacterium]|nr:Crp/Fnr family transcriptional regulator [Flavobacteriales bacterium]
MNDIYDPLLNYISNRIKVNEKDCQIIKESFTPKTIEKKELLFKQGGVCTTTSFILKGSMRMFYLDKKGLEHVLYFGFPDWWVSDIGSFYQHTPSLLNGQALERTELLISTYDKMEELFTEVPALERLFRVITQKNLAALQQRFLSTVSETADQRYLKLLKRAPNIEQLVPQHQIASYLGILPESFSRLKRQLHSK